MGKYCRGLVSLGLGKLVNNTINLSIMFCNLLSQEKLCLFYTKDKQ